MFFSFSFLKVLKNSELYTHGVVAGERECVGNARALYSLSGGNSSQGRTLDNRKKHAHRACGVTWQ